MDDDDIFDIGKSGESKIYLSVGEAIGALFVGCWDEKPGAFWNKPVMIKKVPGILCWDYHVICFHIYTVNLL